MRLDIHVYHHFDGDLSGLDRVLTAITSLQGNISDMNKRLTTAVAELTAEVNENTSKVAGAVAAIQGFPALVAAAVQEALEAADVEAEEAAGLIDAARQSASDQVDSILSAVDANTPPDEVAPAPGTNEEPGDPNDPAVGSIETPPADGGVAESGNES
jgi:ABC-type transporter Mla subunit MlaD